MIGLQYGIAAYRNSVVGIGLLLLMTGLLGWFIGPLLNHRAGGEERRAAGRLRGRRAPAPCSSAWRPIATVTKRDFSFMGKFLFVGMIALLIAMFANMFLQIPVLALVISSLVIVVFSLFLLHDISRIVTGGETNYVMATTGVYISLLNIFVSLLQILTALSGGRD